MEKFPQIALWIALFLTALGLKGSTLSNRMPTDFALAGLAIIAIIALFLFTS